MTKVIVISWPDGRIEAMCAGENVDLVVLSIDGGGPIKVANEEMEGMPQNVLFETVCDHLSPEIQDGRLDLVKLNNALEKKDQTAQ